MTYQETFERRKAELLNDKKLNLDNKKLFKQFFEYEEYKLKRINNLRKLDERCYKTLILYNHQLKNANRWFKNKAWKKLTKEEIKKVYDDLEDGKIKKSNGTPIEDRKSYYSKIFRSKPFALAGKKEIAQEVMAFYKPNQNQEVKFIWEDDFRKIVSVIIYPKQKLLSWLAFDIGENLGTLLILQKKEFIKQINQDTKESEYLVNLPKEKLKRSRTPRSETTNYRETTELLDIILRELKDDDYVFNFGMRQAQMFLDRAVKISGVKCIPQGQKPTFKDLRSSMSCNLLKKGWTSDEINARLGHKFSSRELDKYINHLAIDKQTPKKKVFDSTLAKLQMQLEEQNEKEKLQTMRIENSSKELEQQNDKIRILASNQDFVLELYEQMKKNGKLKGVLASKEAIETIKNNLNFKPE